MSDDVDALVAWLRAQWDADEQAAREASEHTAPAWRLGEDGETVLWFPPEPEVAERNRRKGLSTDADEWRGQQIETFGERIAPHIARHDPADTLARIQAERAILELHANGGKSQGYLHVDEDDDEPVAYGELEHACAACGYIGEYGVAWPCRTLRALAYGYRHRAGWQEGWAP